MPIPSFTIDGVMPPFVGPNGPGGAPEDLSPYPTTATEVVTTLASTVARRTILKGWLGHRASLRAIGFDRGFQWLDGSFVEDKEPQDLDIVGFFYRPPGIRDGNMLARLMQANIALFGRAQVKTTYRLDFFPVDLNGTPEALVSLTRYWLGLFSHRRQDSLWKGMLQVRLEDEADDTAALAMLDPADVQPDNGGAP
ncbi:MAG: hypothetical protein NBV67_02005 [Tagaea sp.]|jgi:hypothetical protein|nr:hypothetical protein [Tagaea sp.]